MAIRGARGGHIHVYESTSFTLDHTKKTHGSTGNSRTAQH